LLLVGGGHAHLEVLRRFAAAPLPGARLTLVSPFPASLYSGMLPGVVAGRYTAEQASIPLTPLARAAGARFVVAAVAGLDLDGRRVRLEDGTTIDFDIVSLDVGSAIRPVVRRGRANAVPVRPAAPFLAGWHDAIARASSGHPLVVAVVGGGLGAIEVALAMRHRLSASSAAAATNVLLIADRLDFAPRARRRLHRALRDGNVAAHIGRRVCDVGDGHVELDDGERIATDRVFVASGPAPHTWPVAAGLADDGSGYVRVDATLRSTSHPFVFAAGDCASVPGRAYARSGVYAVRQGPILAANLRRMLLGQRLALYRPQRLALALVSTGAGDAIALYGPLALHGRLLWHWKDRIDRSFVARYRR
jgi:selenide,water dikinase